MKNIRTAIIEFKNIIKILSFWSIITVIVLFGCVKWMVAKGGLDTDLFWHLKIGEDILSTKHIFLENTYSWLKNTYWNQQEWLYDVLLYLITSCFGVFGFYILAIVPKTVFLGTMVMKKEYHFKFFALFVILLLHLYLPMNLSNRPSSFSTYFFVLFVYLYNKNFKLKPIIYFICGVFIANFHCGAAVALCVLLALLFTLDVVLNFIFLKTNNEPLSLNKKFVIQYIISCLLFIGGLCINPRGFNQVFDMFCVKTLSSTKYIIEWEPFSTSSYIPWIILLVIAYSFGYGLCKHKWDKDNVLKILILSAFLLLSLTSLRGLIIFFYLYIAYGYKYLDEMLYDFIKKINMKPEIHLWKFHINLSTKNISHKKPILIFIFSFSFIFSFISILYYQKNFDNMMFETHKKYLSVNAKKFLKNKYSKYEYSKSPDDFRILNGYVTGNFLLYYDIPCFIDSRQHPYAKEFGYSTAVDDYFKSDLNSYDVKIMDAYFKKYDFNYVISNEEYNVNWYLKQRDDWSLIYSDDSKNYIWHKT